MDHFRRHPPLAALALDGIKSGRVLLKRSSHRETDSGFTFWFHRRFTA